MDIRTIRTELSNYLDYSDEYLRTQVTELIKKLDTQIEEEAQSINMSRAGTVITQYKKDYEINIKEFLTMIRENKEDVITRMNKAREIVAIIDMLAYYIDWVLSRYTANGKGSAAVISQLKSDQETFKNASYKWTAMIASFSAEAKYSIGDDEKDG